MKYLKRYYWIILSLFFIGLDQLTKYLVDFFIPIGESNELIPGFFSLQHVRNNGAAMGILQGHRWVFMVFTAVIIIAAVAFLCSGKVKNAWGILSLAMIIGGGIGNMIDRIFRDGGVVDFFAFNFWGFEFWIFNVADIFVTCGTVILALYILFSSDLDPKKTEAVEEPSGENDG